MAELFAYNEKVETIFDLIGDRENDITKSIAWAFAKCPRLLERVIDKLIHVNVDADDVVIRYQEFEKDRGITDLEITDNRKFYIIIEAKRGWVLPGEPQLKLYSERTGFINSPAKVKAIVSMSECTEEYAKKRLPVIPMITVRHLPWMVICNLAEELRIKSAGKQNYILGELVRYIKRIMTTQNKDTNWVYVVSLGLSKAEITTSEGKKKTAGITYVDIVKSTINIVARLEAAEADGLKSPLHTLLLGITVSCSQSIILKNIWLRTICIRLFRRYRMRNFQKRISCMSWDRQSYRPRIFARGAKL